VEQKVARRALGWQSATEDEMSNTDDSDKYLTADGATEDPVKNKQPSKERQQKKRKAPLKRNATVGEKVSCPWCGRLLAQRSLKRHQENACPKSGKQEVDVKSASPPPSPLSQKRQARKKATSSGSGQPVRSVRTRACKEVVRSTSKRTSDPSSESEGVSRSSQSDWVASSED